MNVTVCLGESLYCPSWYLLGLWYLISRKLWFISPKAKLHLIYKDWLPGKSRQESAVSSEGRLKAKGLLLSRESSVQTQGMKHLGFKSSALCENKNPHFHVFVPQVCRWLCDFFFVTVDVSFCIGRKNKHVIAFLNCSQCPSVTIWLSSLICLPLQVKVAILKYIETLAKQMDPGDFINSSETRLAVSRVITWTTEPKSSDVRKVCCKV